MCGPKKRARTVAAGIPLISRLPAILPAEEPVICLAETATFEEIATFKRKIRRFKISSDVPGGRQDAATTGL